MDPVSVTGKGYVLATAGVIAIPASSALAQVFNDVGLLMLIMGAVGGALNGMLIVGVKWRPFMRSIAIGALLSFGCGVFAVPLVASWMGVEVEGETIPYMGGAAFLIGLMQERVTAFLQRTPGGSDGSEK